MIDEERLKQIFHWDQCHPSAGNKNRFDPESLESGLLLEDRHILLPWGARRFQLIGACSPDRLDNKTAWDEFTWQRPVLFGGLHARYLQVVLYSYGWLDSAWLWLERGRCRRTADRIFTSANRHLTRMLGQPTTLPVYHDCAPFESLVTWQWTHAATETRVALFERTGEPFDDYAFSTIIHIARKSEGCLPLPP